MTSVGVVRVIALAVTALAATRGGPPGAEEWLVHQRGGEISTRDRTCANRFAVAWNVSEHNGTRNSVGGGVAIRSESLPPPRTGEWPLLQHALEFAGGWLVGADNGEFGSGGLWRTNRERTNRTRLLSSNVQSLRSGADGSVLVFTGAAHGITNVGAVYRISQDGGVVRTAKGGDLDGKPRVVSATEGGYLAVTDSGLWQITDAGEPSLLVRINLIHLIPRSVVRALDGTIYIGLKAFVLRLRVRDDSFEPEWLLPPGCPALVLHQGRCACSAE